MAAPLIPLIKAPSEKSAEDAPAWLSGQERIAWADGYNACRGWWLHCQVEALKAAAPAAAKGAARSE